MIRRIQRRVVLQVTITTKTQSSLTLVTPFQGALSTAMQPHGDVLGPDDLPVQRPRHHGAPGATRIAPVHGCPEHGHRRSPPTGTYVLYVLRRKQLVPHDQ